MTIRTCSRSAACAEGYAELTASALASERSLIVWAMSNPFLRGGNIRAAIAIVALTLDELVPN